MKVIWGAVLGLALAASPLAARQEPEDKPKQEEPKKQEPPAQNQDKTKPAENKPQTDQAKQQKATDKQQEQQQKEQEKQTKDADKKQKDNRVQPPQNNFQSNNRGQQSAQASPGRGERIPQEKFQANFGSGHHFHVGHLDNHRFQYGGYWFEVNQAWPTGWSYDDDCYIEDDDGTYYLVDVVHPGIRILVIVVEA
jgi:hypothetical protein